MRLKIACASVLVLLVLSAGAAAQSPRSCEQEIGPLRWLVQKYGSERTTLEFALATSEARRQAAEERVKQLEEALKSAPTGQK